MSSSPATKGLKSRSWNATDLLIYSYWRAVWGQVCGFCTSSLALATIPDLTLRLLLKTDCITQDSSDDSSDFSCLSHDHGQKRDLKKKKVKKDTFFGKCNKSSKKTRCFTRQSIINWIWKMWKIIVNNWFLMDCHDGNNKIISFDMMYIVSSFFVLFYRRG
jgi:hypothetical protein